ncbi:MAG: hypothetical protein JOZ17_10640 [Acetobacteraceae bacterium]|nr:hypothetical protein [Acetobacteraceae bacterium]
MRPLLPTALTPRELVLMLRYLADPGSTQDDPEPVDALSAAIREHLRNTDACARGRPSRALR